MLVDERLDFCAGIGQVERVILVPLLNHPQQIAKASGRPSVRVTGFVG